jgi:glucose dehydrogenase
MSSYMKILFKFRKIALVSLMVASVILIASWFNGDEKGRTWATYKGDEKSTNYAPLDQINVSNVNQLQNAWTFTINDTPQGEPPISSQSNPIIIDGGMYANSVKQWVYAVNAQTGRQIWETTLPAPNNAYVCSYFVGGKQYIARSGGETADNPLGSIMAYALPN